MNLLTLVYFRLLADDRYRTYAMVLLDHLNYIGLMHGTLHDVFEIEV